MDAGRTYHISYATDKTAGGWSYPVCEALFLFFYPFWLSIFSRYKRPPLSTESPQLLLPLVCRWVNTKQPPPDELAATLPPNGETSHSLQLDPEP